MAKISKTTPEQWELTTKNGDKILVDQDIYLRLVGRSIWLSNGKYPTFRDPSIKYLHRFVMAAGSQHVDHINHNTLDCRRSNLRLCTNQQNSFNKQISKVNKSGFKGVSWDKFNNKWVVRIKINNICKNIGRFANKEAAALAYNEAAKEYFGNFAFLNEVQHG